MNSSEQSHKRKSTLIEHCLLWGMVIVALVVIYVLSFGPVVTVAMLIDDQCFPSVIAYSSGPPFHWEPGYCEVAARVFYLPIWILLNPLPYESKATVIGLFDAYQSWWELLLSGP